MSHFRSSSFCHTAVLFMLLAGAGSVAANQPVTGALPLEQVELYQIGPIDNAALLAADAARSGPGIPLRFALPVEAKITPASHGTHETLSGDVALWRLRIASPGAVSLNLGFTGYRMPEGGQLLIHATNGKIVRGPFTAADNESHGELWTPIIAADEIVVELTLPSPHLFDQLRLELTSINHGYRQFGQRRAKSGACNVDVICPEGDGWRDQIRSVAVISTGGSTFCTGFAVNNTALDQTPYFMTAYHCGINAGNAASLVVYWNYENSTCRPPGSGDSGGPGDGTLDQFQTGSYFRAGWSTSDFTLVELDDPIDPDHAVYLAGWDHTSDDASSAVAIHHPNTDEKRISFENDPTTTTSYLGTTVPGDGTHVRVTDWDLGTTEPGSSGSPLFNQDQRIIGQLHGGYAACGNDDSDWYGRLSVSWNGGGSASTRVADYLDPGGSGATVLDGIEASDGFAVSADPVNLLICSAEDGVYQVTVSQLGTFSAPVTLSAVGNPGTATFSVNPVTPPGTSELTLTGVAVGEYGFTIEGSEGGTTHGTAVTLSKAAATPATPTLLTPADGAVDQPLSPHCTWSAVASFGSYEIDIATDAGFTTIVESASSLTTAEYYPQSLTSNTVYYWRVRAVNGCGTGPYASHFSFTTLPAPGDCSIGETGFTIYNEEFEGGAGDWTHSGTGDTWALSTTRAWSGSTSFHADDPAAVSDQRLVSPEVTLPAAGSPIYLRFYTFQEIEDRSGGCYDGGILEISTDSGASWTQLDVQLQTDPYDGPVSNSYGNPLQDLDAWCGDPQDWLESIVDVTAFAGQTASFRFRLGSDTSVSREGWYVDDVRVISCGAVPVELMSFSVE